MGRLTSVLFAAAAAQAPLALAAQTTAVSPPEVFLADMQAQSQTRRMSILFDGYAPVPIIGQIKVGETRIEADIGPERYRADAHARAGGIVGWFVDYNLFLDVEGAVTADGLRPRTYNSFNDDGNKNRRVDVTYSADDVVTVAEPRFGSMGEPAANLEQRLEGIDPISAIMSMGLSIGATPDNPCGDPLQVYDGKQRYDLVLTYNQSRTMQTPAWNGPAIQCDIDYVEIAGFRSKTPEKRAEERADIAWLHVWLGEYADGARVPIKLEGRSNRRGKISLIAREASFEPVDTVSRQADASGVIEPPTAR